MKTYVINLERRRDRMALMAAQLHALGLSYERIDALDAQTVTDDVLARHWPPDGDEPFPVTRGAKCCFISHRRSWEKIAASADEWAAVVEDDGRLHPDAAFFLAQSDWIPKGAGLIKIEVNFLRRNARILLGKEQAVGRGYSLAPLLSKHMGAGGYILSRECAAFLVNVTARMARTVDTLLFNPNASTVFRQLGPLQLVPALLAQSTESGASDLARWRGAARQQRLRGVRGAIANMARSFEEMRTLPSSALRLISGRAKLAEVGFGASGSDDPAWAVRSPFS